MSWALAIGNIDDAERRAARIRQQRIDHYRWIGKLSAEARVVKTQEKILAAMTNQDHHYTAAEIAGIVGASPSGTLIRLHALEINGEIEKYAITGRGNRPVYLWRKVRKTI